MHVCFFVVYDPLHLEVWHKMEEKICHYTFISFLFFLLPLLCCKAPFSTFFKCPGKGKSNKTSDRRTRGTVSSKHHSTKTFQQYLHDG